MPEPSATRGKRPRGIRPGQSISNYSQHDLQRVIRWIESDGQLRTRDELLSNVMEDMHFTRRGHKIVELIEQAIAAERSRNARQ
jgi:hypothetical protein